ncbi:hypothetical protein GEV33_013887 [Tenebrio molitor]|uniref:Uncharacterized protein n=1 Tax=Tenebrio molitor TaxID=7067 RepID=A0A8J6H6A8_TENMO|nr:hypothetical protein GEV33_013887 [Tenebrio molitor]
MRGNLRSRVAFKCHPGGRGVRRDGNRLPADGVKGKTWGPSTCHQRERGQITMLRPAPNRSAIWSKSAPNLDKTRNTVLSRPPHDIGNTSPIDSNKSSGLQMLINKMSALTTLSEFKRFGSTLRNNSFPTNNASLIPKPGLGQNERLSRSIGNITESNYDTVFSTESFVIARGVSNSVHFGEEYADFSNAPRSLFTFIFVLDKTNALLEHHYGCRMSIESGSVSEENLPNVTYFIPPEDWGPEYPIPGTVRHNVPIPTLYSADGQRLKPKLSIVELVLYNIAAMLAGVASGYDVRLSNVSPLHPRLQPNRPEVVDLPAWRPVENQDYEYSTTSGYSHNTYHGPTRHCRPMLTGSQLINLQHEEQRPLRFTDSPQHHPPNPSPRRKSSSTSNDGSELYPPYDRTATIYVPGDYQTEPPHCPGCSGRPDPYHYGHHPDHSYAGYSSEYSGTTMYGYGTDYAYDNPSSMSSHSGSRTPQRLPQGHRRTPSNVSNSSTTTSGSNVNPSFKLEDEGSYTSNYLRRQYDFEYGSYSRQNSQESNFERPTTLETSGYTKLRSSLKRNNYQASQGHSGGNTPTNPTPPDSLTSDDSSYVSAKDSNSSVSRVRFSPTTLIDLPVPGQNQDPTVPLQARRTRQKALVEKEFWS